jgi:hypothetical protein
MTDRPLRPRWMAAVAIWCFLTVLVTMSSDLFVADARAVEVWFGFEVTGRAAILTAPIHWTIFAVFAWAFWTGRAWIIPWAATYVFYVALCHLVWSEASPHGRGWPIGLAQAVAIAAVGVVLLRACPASPADSGRRAVG